MESTTRMIPMTLKNNPDAEDFCIVLPVILNKSNIGNVPKAKLNIVKPPAKKLHVESV